MKRSGSVTAVMVVLVALVSLVGGVRAPAPARAEAMPVQRLMIMGDSITHGSAGDWTWRYFLWRHLVATGAGGAPGVDLVGPVDDLCGNPVDGGCESSQDYVDPFFDRDHAARWGNRLDFAMHDPSQLARDHDPDVVVILLGFNDLVFLEQAPAEVEQSMRDTIAALRHAAPGVDVVVGRIPIVTRSGVPETNERYSSLAAELDTEAERVVVAEADAGFVPSTPTTVEDTYDPAHPTSRGELKIAAAVADALAGLGIGAPYPRPLAQLPLGPRTGALLEADASDGSARLSWVSAAGTTGEVVWARDVTAGGTWQQRTDVLAGTSAGLTGLVNGHTYEVALQPAKGWAVAPDTRSNVVELTPRASVPDTPRGLSGRAVDHGVRLEWRDVPSATSYVVSWRVAGAEDGRQTVEVPGSAARVRGLVAGASYAFRVHAVDDGTAGEPSARLVLEPSGPRPAAPTLTGARALAADLVRLRWTTVRRATHYVIQVRDVTGDGPWREVQVSRPVSDASALVPGLRGRTTYAFKVRSWHQQVQGGVSSAVEVRTPRG